MGLVRAYRIPVEAHRCGVRESIHTVDVSLVAATDDVAAAVDAPEAAAYGIDAADLPISWIRSTAKPFQLLPYLMQPEGAAFFADDADIAIAVSSHDGTPDHAERVAAMLQRAGLAEGDLRCGVHRPYFLQRLAPDDAAHAASYGALHNNCSGNHTALLLWGRANGVATGAYLDAEQAGQQTVHAVVRAASAAEVSIGVDNCGAPCYRMPLEGLARAYACLAHPAGVGAWPQLHTEPLAPVGQPAQFIEAFERIATAMAGEPRWVSGEGTEATRMAQCAPGQLVLKHGAEGVLAVADRARRLALALKVRDGNARALFPALLRLWSAFGWCDADHAEHWQALATPVLKGPPGHPVGELRAAEARPSATGVADARTPAV